jgi:hypothetical protein
MSIIEILDEVYDENTLSSQQIEAGERIINYFENDSEIRWIVLLAQMQSGKTETYLFVCCELIRRRMVDNIVIFSGNAETDLRDQLKIEAYDDYELAKKYNKIPKFFNKYNIYLEETIKLTTRTRMPVINNIKSNIHVLWGTDLNKHNKIYQNTLFLWEESHYAQTIHQCPDKFLKKVGIEADGDVDLLREKNNYVLSISATPFSEISDVCHQHQNKKIVYMRPGVGYTSVKDIKDSGRLKPFRSLEFCELRNALLAKQESPKFALIRVSNKTEEIVKRIAMECNWDIVNYDSVSETDVRLLGQYTWNNMKNAPEKNTVILLRGKCRMGKNLEKSHILFVMETSSSSNTDTILQGLLGRVCGYSDGSNRIDVYLHQKIINSGEIQRYIELIDGLKNNNNCNTIPSKACNILKKNAKSTTKTPIIPILVTISTDFSKESDIKKEVRENICKSDFNFGKTDPEQFKEIRDRFIEENRFKELNKGTGKKNPKNEIVVHHVTKDLDKHDNNGEPKKNQNTIKKWQIVSKKFQKIRDTTDETPEALWTTGTDEELNDGTKLEAGRIIHIFYYEKDNEEYDIKAGSAYIYGVTEASNMNYVISKKIPKTTGREVFATRYENGDEKIQNGAYCIKLPFETVNNISIMKKYILKFIELSIEYSDSRSVYSQWDDNQKEWKGIMMKKNVVKSLKSGGIIYNEAIQLGFRIVLSEPKKVKKYDNIYRYSSISWVSVNSL